MRGAVVAALAAHWRRRPWLLVALVAGLALATALWTAVQAINAEARASYARAAAQVSAASFPTIERTDGAAPGMADFFALRRGGWLVSPVIQGRAVIASRAVRVLGLDPFTAPAGLAPDAMLPGPGSLAAGVPLFAAPALAATVGAVPVAGLPPDLAVTELGRAAELLGPDESPSRLILLPGQPLRQAPLATLGPYRVAAPVPAPDLSALTASFHLNLTAFGLLAFAVGLFIVHGTVGFAFEERRPLIRTLRALGVPLGTLGRVMAGELVVLALVAGALGVVLGGLIAALLLPDVAASLRALYGAEVAGALRIRPVWWASGLGMALGGTLLAGAGALWRLGRVPVLAAARPQDWSAGTSRLVRAGVLAGALLLAVAVVVLWRGEGLLAGFAGLGALLLGAALILPGFLALVLGQGARRARDPLTRWVWADTRQQLPALSLALMALMLALATNIGVATMVGSFRATFEGWLDQRLVAQLYIDAGDRDTAGRLEAWLAPRVDAVLPLWQGEATAGGAPVSLPISLYGFRDDPAYREHWPILARAPGLWDGVAAGRGVLINEQLARRLHLAPGDTLALPGWSPEILGIYSDYGNPQGQVMLSLDALAAHFTATDQSRLAVRLPPGGVAALRAAIVQDFGLPPDRLTDQAAQKAAALAIFERTFLVTGALDGLTLAVAGLAMLIALTTLAGMRLPHLAPVWAMGGERRALAALEVARSLGLAALASVAAVPVGIALAWVLLAVVNVQAFGWRLPLRLSEASIAAPVLMALGAAVLAALPGALRLVRRPVADLLAVFASER